MSRPLRAEAPSVCRFCARLSPVELERLDEAALVNHQTRSEFARWALVIASNDCVEEAAARSFRTPKP